MYNTAEICCVNSVVVGPEIIEKETETVRSRGSVLQ